MLAVAKQLFLMRCKAFRAQCAECTSVKNNAAACKNSISRRAAPQIRPFCVDRRLFGFTKLLSSRLDWPYLGLQRFGQH